MQITVLIVHSQDGVYDVFVNDEWKISRNSADNIFAYLSNNFKNFNLTFIDKTI